MDDFKQQNKSIYSITRRFAEVSLTRCPLCGEEKSQWLIREQWRLLGKDYYYQCPSCGTVLKTSQDDVTGLSFTPATFAGQMKKYRGKDLRKVYITIDKGKRMIVCI